MAVAGEYERGRGRESAVGSESVSVRTITEFDNLRLPLEYLGVKDLAILSISARAQVDYFIQ